MNIRHKDMTIHHNSATTLQSHTKTYIINSRVSFPNFCAVIRGVDQITAFELDTSVI